MIKGTAIQTDVMVWLFVHLLCTPHLHFCHTCPNMCWRVYVSVCMCVYCICMCVSVCEYIQHVVDLEKSKSSSVYIIYQWKAYLCIGVFLYLPKWTESIHVPMNQWSCLFMCVKSTNAKIEKTGLQCAYNCVCMHTHAHLTKPTPGYLCIFKPALMSPLLSHNASVYKLTGNRSGWGGSSVRCRTIRLVPFPLIALTPSHLECDTSNAEAFLCHLIDQNKHIILW